MSETPHLNRLPAPVVLVTRGRGLERFEDSAALLRRLAEIPALQDEVMQIQEGKRLVLPAGIAALNAMFRVCGLARFETACRRRPHGGRARGTKYEWAFLSDYLGWEWSE